MDKIQRYNFNENPYKVVFCDITPKCDMRCNICYSSNQQMKDLDLELLEDAVSQFPKKNVCMTMLGGEPTTSPNIFRYIEIINEYGHCPMLSTNGKRISQDPAFVKQLSEYYHNGNLRVHMDMSGGYNKELHAQITGDPKGMQYKFGALDMLRDYGIGRVTIACVLVRGLNESSIDDLFKIAKEYNDVVYEIFFRPQFPLGRHFEQDTPYTTNEFLNILLKKRLFTRQDLSKTMTAGWLYEQCEGKNCCFRFVKDGLSVGFVEVFTQSCWQRGRLSNGINYLEDFYAASKRDCV